MRESYKRASLDEEVRRIRGQVGGRNRGSGDGSTGLVATWPVISPKVCALALQHATKRNMK
jgi:hypothetical protein